MLNPLLPALALPRQATPCRDTPRRSTHRHAKPLGVATGKPTAANGQSAVTALALPGPA